MPRTTPQPTEPAAGAGVPQPATQPVKPRKARRKAKGRARAAAPRSLPNVAPQREFDARSAFKPQDRPRDMPTVGNARLAPPEIEIARDGPKSKEHIAELAFMDEPVEVLVHSSTDRNAEPIVETWCNGRSQYFVRNERQTVKRKFVERLARSRTTSYTQQHYKDANGYDAIRNIPHTALRYPFSVTRDDNPRGRAWLEKILAEA